MNVWMLILILALIVISVNYQPGEAKKMIKVIVVLPLAFMYFLAESLYYFWKKK